MASYGVPEAAGPAGGVSAGPLSILSVTMTALQWNSGPSNAGPRGPGRPLGSLACVDRGGRDRAVLDVPLLQDLGVGAVLDDRVERLLQGVAQLGVLLADADAEET